MAGPVSFVWICGPSGVGKTSVGWSLFSRLYNAGVRSAYLDFDQIGFCRPAPADDPDNLAVSAANLAAVWPTFRARQVRALVSSGIVHTAEEIARYAAAVPDAELTVCRLRARPEVLAERMRRRAAGYGAPLADDDWTKRLPTEIDSAIAASVREAEGMDERQLGDVTIDTDGRDAAAVAELVQARCFPDGLVSLGHHTTASSSPP